MNPPHIAVEWRDLHREPQQKPDPNHPNGIHIEPVLPPGTPTCYVELRPYPTPRCGLFIVTCHLCSQKVAITTSGRPDDPRSVVLPCMSVHNPAPEEPRQ
jgi:hypothetical protein